jgi:hypothetical protein
MGMKVRKGGVWRDIVSAKVFESGVWRELVQIKVFKSSSWRTVANFTTPAGGGGGGGGVVSVTISPTSISAHTEDNLAAPTGSLTATPSGGLAPYIYSWALVSVTSPATGVLINKPTLASTTATVLFSTYGLATVTLRCTVTDSLGSVGTATVSGTANAVSTL